MEERSYKQNHTLEWIYYTTLENKQYLAMMENPKRQNKHIGAEYNFDK